MIPHNFNPGLMQQHQQHQQAQQLGSQQGQPQQEGHPQLDARAWQQQMQAMQLRQAGGDQAAQQQMMEIMRQRSMQAQQQQQQQQRQQQFGNGQQHGIPGQQGLGMGGQAGGPQQPSMGQGAPGPQHSQHMQGGFPGAPGLSNQQSMQQTMNRAAMMQALQNGGPQFTRQLDLMLQQQGQQQPQGSPMQMQARLEQQRQQMGTNPAGSQMAHQLQPGAGQQPRRLTPQELTQRAGAIRMSINNMEDTYQKINQGMAPGPEKDMRLQGLARDINVRKEAFAKMQQALTQMAQNGGQLPPTGLGPSPYTGGFENPGNSQPPRPMSTQATGPSPNVQPSPSHVHSTPLQQPNLLPNQPGVVPPPRSGPTPSQQAPHPPNGTPGGPGPSNNAVAGTPNPFGQMSPSMGQLFPFNNSAPNASNPSPSAPGVQQMPSGGPPGVSAWPPALEKQKFDAAYKTYSARTGIKHEMRLMNMDGKPIDLYALHVNVMQEGGWTKVHNKELWSVIGGRMGFVNFPGSDSEPAKSGPGVAQRLAQVYKEYLSGFDQVYINSVIDSRRKMQANQAGNGATMPGMPINNAIQGQPGAQGVPGAAGPLGGAGAGLKPPFNNPVQLAKLMQFASLPPDQLRSQGLPEHMIQFIEQNRANIQRASQQGQMQQAAAALRAQVPEQTPGGQSQPQLGSPFGGVAGLPPSNQPGQGQSFPGQPPNNMHGMHPAGLPDGQPHMPSQQTMFAQAQAQAPGITGPPNPEQIQVAQNFISRVQLEFRQRNLPTFRPFELPSEGRAEYQSMFQQLVVQVDKLGHRMPYLYFALRSEDAMRKVIAMVMTAKYQQQLLTSGNPRVIITPDLLRTMLAQVHGADNALTQFFVNKAQRPPVQGQMPGGMPDMSRQQPPMVQPPPQLIPQQQPPIQPPNQPQSIPPNTLPNNRMPMNLRPPPKKGPATTPGANQPLSAPTPPYSATTPVASASTPSATATASSPQQNQPISSPKTRAKAKPATPNAAKQPAPRRPSVKGQNAAPTTTEPVPAAPAAKVDAAGSNAPTPNTGKRPREEEPVPGPSTSIENVDASSSAVANEPSPPKRMKTDWDVPASEESKKNQEAAENVKNEEDASAFLEQMTELIRQSGQESTLSSDISETLDMLLKGCGNSTDGLDLSSLNAFGESSTLGSTGKPSVEDFGDFFDWASFNNTQADESKAPTPELSTSSSTNPSPESGSESEAAHHSTALISDAKADEIPELLKLGTWKEIDGGESAYYQPSEWKWDGLMSTQDQPWAIS